MKRVKEIFADPNEQYPTLDQACYTKYQCNWCCELAHLVEPTTHRAGGGIMHEKVKGRETGRAYFMCLSCIQFEKFRQRNENFLI